MLTGWYVGYVIAAVLIAVVVVLVALLLGLARTITVQVLGIAEKVSDIRETTAPLPLVGRVNDDLTVIVNRAVQARGVLEAGA